MYFGDHPPPHFHIASPDGAMTVAIRSRVVLAGKLPKQVAKEALAWAARNEAHLMERWVTLSERTQQR